MSYKHGMSLPVFLGCSPKLLCGVTMECAAPAIQTRSRQRRCSRHRTGTCINTSPASVFTFFTTLPILESKSKGGKENGFGSALPSLIIFQKSGSTTSWSAPVLLSKQCKKKRMFLALDWDVYKYPADSCSILLYNTSNSGVQNRTG